MVGALGDCGELCEWTSSVDVLASVRCVYLAHGVVWVEGHAELAGGVQWRVRVCGIAENDVETVKTALFGCWWGEEVGSVCRRGKCKGICCLGAAEDIYALTHSHASRLAKSHGTPTRGGFSTAAQILSAAGL